MEKMVYYPGTTKKIADPFCVLSCKCGFKIWSVLPMPVACPICGGQAMPEKEEEEHAG